ncbi:metallophosphoesterase family protein [Clostridium sp. 1001271B_151109_B4]|uniref:metallophosphoesterase family protein n=1 Tax=Clostridium sp. 1001271B_151109_B4 TaxID=2787148 RepID=UPI0018AC6B64|nr:metallophosphoesterase family protein [Clostridium sp. 1001271B_151109_B4]
MKLGVISDTHGVLREEVIEYLRECDYIIHAGDVGNKDIIDKLDSIAKTFVVRGNNDKDEWGLTLPEYREIEMDEILIYLVHDKADIPKDLKEVDLVIYGHSHKFSNEKIDNIIYLNPGSCGKKRFSLPLSMAIVEVNLDELKVKKIDI